MPAPTVITNKKMTTKPKQLNFGQVLQQKMLELKLVPNLDGFIGCTPDEIEAVRIGQQVDFLPKIYREFLMEMGRLARPLMPYEVYWYPHLSELKDWLVEDAESHNLPVTLPEDAFLVAMSSDDRCFYFHTAGQEENPMIYEYFLAQPSLPVVPLNQWFDLILQAAVQHRSCNLPQVWKN